MCFARNLIAAKRLVLKMKLKCNQHQNSKQFAFGNSQERFDAYLLQFFTSRLPSAASCLLNMQLLHPASTTHYAVCGMPSTTARRCNEMQMKRTRVGVIDVVS
jgi:hypothetical protein